MEIPQDNQTTRLGLKSDIRLPSPPGSAILFGHADADGHLAAEQSREWLVKTGFSVTVVVSSETRNYRFWERLPRFDLSSYGLVVTVDVAFRFRDPDDSLATLLAVSDSYPNKEFIVIDHHPLVRPQVPRKNVQLIEVDDPYDCCLGVPNPELMAIAALCDGASTSIAPTPQLRQRALGIKRAAADVGGAAGYGLLQLIRERRWDFFEALAEEDIELHRSVRGVRRSTNRLSPLLEYARGLSSSAVPK